MKPKTICISLFGVLMFFLIIPVVSINSAVLSIEPADVKVKPGDEFAVTAAISDVNGLFGIFFEMQYDGLILEYVSSRAGSFMGSDVFPPFVRVGNNSVNMAITMKAGATPASNTASDLDTIATITFRARAKGTSRISYRQDNSILQRKDGTPIPFTVENGNVTVIDGSPILIVQVCPNSLPADGTSKATVTATVIDSSGTPLPGQDVQMRVSTGSGTLSEVTDVKDGTYTATYVASTRTGIETITATVEGNSKTVNISLTSVPGREAIELTIPELHAMPGETIIAPINVDNVMGVCGADITIAYDSYVLTAIEARETGLSSEMNPLSNLDIPGQVIIAMASIKPAARGSGALVEIVFKVAPDVETDMEIPITFTEAAIYDESGEAIPVSIQNGKLTVSFSCVKGDVNGDGLVKSNDAILALRIAARLMTPTPEQECAADVNNDGIVKSNDSIIILRNAAGMTAPTLDIAISNRRQLTIIMTEAYGSAGGSTTSALMVDDADVLAGGDICIAYDPSVLRAVDVLPHDNLLMASNFVEPGTMHIAFANPDSLDIRMIAMIEFEVVADDVSPLEFRNVELCDLDALPLNTRCINTEFKSWFTPARHSALFQNFPNPFNPATWIPYQLEEDSDVTISIYLASGELVRELKLGYRQAGFYKNPGRAAYWDGTNTFGEPLASGIYFYSIRAGDFSEVKKLVILE
jgi:hypothetical protein